MPNSSPLSPSTPAELTQQGCSGLSTSLIDQLMTTGQPQTQTEPSASSCTLGQSSPSLDPESLTRVQLDPVEPQQSLPPHNPEEGGPCSPNTTSQPWHRWDSPSPHSTAQVSTSPHLSLTQDTEPTLDQESPGSTSPADLHCGVPQDKSTLDQDSLSVYCRLADAADRLTLLRPVSAPCSPSPVLLQISQHTLSDPASPIQNPSGNVSGLFSLDLDATSATTITEPKSLEYCPMQMSPSLVNQTLTSSLRSVCATTDQSKTTFEDQPVQTSIPPRVPVLQTPQSVDHISSSVEHGGLPSSPCAIESEKNALPAGHIDQGPCDSALVWKGSVEVTRPLHIQASPRPYQSSSTFTAAKMSPFASLTPSVQGEEMTIHSSPVSEAETSSGSKSSVDTGTVYPEAQTSPGPKSPVNPETVHLEAKTSPSPKSPVDAEAVHLQAETSCVPNSPVDAETVHLEAETSPGPKSPVDAETVHLEAQTSPGPKSPVDAETVHLEAETSPSPKSPVHAETVHQEAQTSGGPKSPGDAEIVHLEAQTSPGPKSPGDADTVHLEAETSPDPKHPVDAETVHLEAETSPSPKSPVDAETVDQEAQTTGGPKSPSDAEIVHLKAQTSPGPKSPGDADTVHLEAETSPGPKHPVDADTVHLEAETSPGPKSPIEAETVHPDAQSSPGLKSPVDADTVHLEAETSPGPESPVDADTVCPGAQTSPDPKSLVDAETVLLEAETSPCSKSPVDAETVYPEVQTSPGPKSPVDPEMVHLEAETCHDPESPVDAETVHLDAETSPGPKSPVDAETIHIEAETCLDPESPVDAETVHLDAETSPFPERPVDAETVHLEAETSPGAKSPVDADPVQLEANSERILMYSQETPRFSVRGPPHIRTLCSSSYSVVVQLSLPPGAEPVKAKDQEGECHQQIQKSLDQSGHQDQKEVSSQHSTFPSLSSGLLPTLPPPLAEVPPLTTSPSPPPPLRASSTTHEQKSEGELVLSQVTSSPVAVAAGPTSDQSEKGEKPGEGDRSDVEEEGAVSPVLDLDREVMELMTSSLPPSLLHLSSSSTLTLPRRGKGRSLRPPPLPSSSVPVDDLSIRLRMSPFSTEASPETSPAREPVTPPPLTPPSPPTRETPPLSKATPTTILPLTPKIGMGKPAISKRKFSPGKARLKQGSWWTSRSRAVSPPSSSQDSFTGEGGWDSPRPRPPPLDTSPLLWSMRVGRGSGFPGRRRSRGGGGGRGGRGRSRLKTQASLTVSPGSYIEPFQPKEEEENSMHNTVVMFSTSDHFTLKQDMCVVCGSFGQGSEGRLLACSQCGQCYHPYCVNVKITRVVLTKGWRCLECTVCEACGEASDPGRLLLCDDCDISYHTYCLDPPLLTVPKGAWKCKWCVWCVQCGSASPGLNCDWQSNYSLCGPCCSLSCCPVCLRPYLQDDLILQCQQCDRWVHAVCQGLTTEDEVEVAADEGFDCSLCRTHGHNPYGRSDSLGPYMTQIISRIREPGQSPGLYTKTYTQDGVCLTESGLTHLQSLVEPLTSHRRMRRCKPNLKLRIINQNSVSVLQTPSEPDTPTELDQGRDCEMKSDSSPERDHAPDDDIIRRETDVINANKKKKRKPYRPGIGGFMVRQRGAKSGPGRIKLCKRDSMEMLPGRDEDATMETVSQALEKVKKRYRKKKTKLEEEFPSYLQEAFFGRDLLDRSRQVEKGAGPGVATATVQSGSVVVGAERGPAPAGPRKPGTATAALPVSQDMLVDLSEVLNTEPHILNTGHAGHFQVEQSRSALAGLDLGAVTSELTGSGGRGQRATGQEEPLDAILNPELDKMVTDGAILSRLYKIPELKGKDVEEVFTAVLSPDGSQSESSQHTGIKTRPHSTALPPMIDGGSQVPTHFRMHPSQTAIRGPAPGPVPSNQSVPEDGEVDGLSTAQRSMLKWEKEEPLGELATVAPVLYCNTNFPQLRQQYPDWPTRVKQIAKLWRKASTEDRAPYVQKARDNRAAQRINKVQLTNDPLKRQPPPSALLPPQQQPQPPLPQLPPPTAPYDPVAMAFKDPLRPKESEQEQEWKLRQQMRQKSKQLAKMEAIQKLEQVKNEQRQQQLMANQRLSPESGSRSPGGGGASPLQLPPSRPQQGPANDVFLRPQAPPPSGFSPQPSSPQMFSPPSSRPSSPWDPYNKVVGTPRSSTSTGGSPAVSPDSRASDTSRSLPGLQQTRAAMMSPPSGSSPDHRPVRLPETFQRTSSVRTGDLGHGSVFKAPMPPRPSDLVLVQSQDPQLPSSPLSGLGSPHQSPYTQTPGTPRPDYGQQPSPDPYTNPQTPGTPRPHSDPSYLTAPAPLRLDTPPYSSTLGTPHASLPDRFSSSPGGQQSSTPHPQKVPEPFSQNTAEGFPPQGGPASSSSPLGPGQMGELAPFTQLGHQQSPGPQHDQFPRTPKHPGISEDGDFSRTPGHDPFSQGHITAVTLQSDKTTNEISVLGGTSLDGSVSMLPQLGDSEEKLRQRQRLRQLLLRQQEQKSALRQEKGLQDPPHGPVPHSWPQENSAPPPSDLFGRPPPPYPGTVHPVGAVLPQRLPVAGFSPTDAPFPRQTLVRGAAPRFGALPRPQTGLQDPFLHPPQGAVPVSGHGSVEGVPVQMRRSMNDFTAIQPITAPHPHHVTPGVPQPLLPRSLPIQQHSIMGQPYIELRHHAPENRLRLPLATVSETPIPHIRGPQPTTVRPSPGSRVGGSKVIQQMTVGGGMEQQTTSHTHSLTQSGDAGLTRSDGIEDHLEGEDSAVKDLEDVEVKDLVDLNLNLDPEDGKEDLDLGPNDLHLDDFLLSGKFDLIAYADPELNLEDTEELVLGESMEEKEGGARKMESHAHPGGQLKPELKEAGNNSSVSPPPTAVTASNRPAGALGVVLLTKAKQEDSALQEQPPSRVHLPLTAGSQSVFQQPRPFGPSPILTPQPQDPPAPPHPSMTPPAPQPQPPQPRPFLNAQTQLPQPGIASQVQNQNKCRPLLLEEQPLLLQDLLDQERQEQQQQQQMQALIRQRSTTESPLSNMDFDSISDPIMKAKMVVLTGINKVMNQNPMAINRFQQPPGAPVPEVPPQPPHLIGQDSKAPPQLMRTNPPNFVNESQRRQYEEWLGETQQLLQMQQRLLEEQITAHRKTKKALSAKQRTAKRAGRVFAEEDAAQLRCISEQQGAVQKQLEQIRKQQKDHAELIEDYRSKHQRPPQTGVSIPPHVSNNPTGWTPGPRMTPPALVPCLSAPTGGTFTASTAGATGDVPAPQVKFDDNNPFSEGFQERERRERLREQQERQRLQLMQEVEHHRALQQRLNLEHKGHLGTPAVPDSGAHLSPKAGPGGSAPPPGGDGLSQMTFFSAELPQDFLQSPPGSRPPPQHQAQPGSAQFPPQTGLHQGFSGGGPTVVPPERTRTTTEHGPLLRLPEVPGTSVQGLISPGVTGPPGSAPNPPVDQRFGHDSSSSSLVPPHSISFPSSSPIQLHPESTTTDDKPKKCRKDGDNVSGGVRTPLSSNSDDITAPPTPSHSDTTCSTPTRSSVDQSDASLLQSSILAPSSELERQLSVSATIQRRASVLGMDGQRGPLSAAGLEVKEEREEGRACGGVVKMEVGAPPPQGGDAGKELLRHLLKEKTCPNNTPPPQAPPPAHRQPSNDSVQSEVEEDGSGYHGDMVCRDSPDLLSDPSERSRPPPPPQQPQRCKRAARPDKDRTKFNKRRKREEEEEKHLCSSSPSSPDPLMTHLRQQLSILPLMEPVLGVDLTLFPPYGSSSLGSDSRLSGTFGNASLDGITDYYSQLIYKQNNLSNPPTPPASLPPTPPPVVRQKLVNGFATTEEITARKDIRDQDGVSPPKQKGEELLTVNHTSKTVDVPASLLTPPHNNQEELRVQDVSERDSPDSFVPSSSPESVADMEVSRYPDLSFIKLEPPSPCPSPTLPVMPCAKGKGSAVKQEVKAEPNRQAPPSCSNTDLVTIAITLNPVAAQNVPSVLAAVAALLRVSTPVNYQLIRAAVPEHNNLALLAGVRVPLTQSLTGGRTQRAAGNSGVQMDHIQHGRTARPQCCSHCKVVLGNRVRIIRDLKQEGRPGPSLVFCSPNCSSLYTSELQSRSTGSKLFVCPQPTIPVLPSSCEPPPPPSRGQHQYTNNMSSITVHSLPPALSSHPPTSSSPPLFFPSASAITMETRPHTDSLKVKVKLKPHPRAVPGGEESASRHGKKMKSSHWRRWSVSITLSRGPCIPSDVITVPAEEEMDILLKKFGASLRPDLLPKDQRRCCFCHQQGDGQTDGPARLLNLDLDLWVHLNCALWSSEVYETQAGALINVELALRRGLTLRCAHCHQTGATSGCNRLRCTNTYHFSCAIQAQCIFFKDKTMLCHLHKPRPAPLVGDRFCSTSPSSSCSSTPGPTPVVMASCDPYDSELHCFSVFRRVFVQRDEARQIAAVVQRGERQHTFRVGSLLFRAVGRLLPQQMNAFHNHTAIFPVGYHTNRFYWSMRHSNRRCKYMCYIEEKDGEPLFKVKVVEKGHEDLVLTGPTPKAVWDKVLEPISQIRTSSGTLKLFPTYLKGEDLFGLTTSAVTRIIESLPGVEACDRYMFRFGRNPLMEWPLAFNPSGSARSEPKACQAKRPFLLTSVAPRCQGSVGSIVGVVPGVISLSPGESVAGGSHQGRHSKSSQYRRMKAEWKSNVYLARSRIQGLGLYAARDIEKCTMVIEYIGTIIRSEVANRKERLYESQNRGVYMFRIDNDYVIDATITGGPARYINHSCAPNCITEVVTVEKENKIVISSCRRIQRGEELCYDYKFDLEDDQHKIPCHCGAVNCRKWMN
ncbi:histone-lysine N-methyltransferase 2C-like [Pholidichthys leucotaenia]